MSRNDVYDRRSTLRLLTAGAAATLLAGCAEEMGEGDEGEELDDEREEHVDEVIEAGDPQGEPEDWEDVDAIELVVTDDEDRWIGRQPDVIEDVENPALRLFEGREYEFVWTNRDGDVHNLAIWDDDHESLASTESIDDEDESVGFVLEASEELAIYLCETHGTEMAGAIELHTD